MLPFTNCTSRSRRVVAGMILTQLRFARLGSRHLSAEKPAAVEQHGDGPYRSGATEFYGGGQETPNARRPRLLPCPEASRRFIETASGMGDSLRTNRPGAMAICHPRRTRALSHKPGCGMLRDNNSPRRDMSQSRIPIRARSADSGLPGQTALRFNGMAAKHDAVEP